MTAPMLAMELASKGVRAVVADGESVIPLDLRALEISRGSLVTVAEQTGESYQIPFFPSLLHRLGEAASVRLEGLGPEKPHVHLRNLLARITPPLRRGWEPAACISIVVPAHATDLDRSVLVEEAKAAGWAEARLVNKTSALSVHALDRRRSGNHLSLVLGHSAAEASIVRWEGNRLRALCYAVEPGLSGEAIQRRGIALLLQGIAEGLKTAPPLEVYDFDDWMWLRNRIGRLELRMQVDDVVVVEVPSTLTGGADIDVRFQAAVWNHALKAVFDEIRPLITRCCEEAGVNILTLQSCMVTGGLGLNTRVRESLRGIFGSVPVVLFGAEAQASGAARLTAMEAQQAWSFRDARIAPSQPFHIRARDAALPAAEPSAPRAQPPAAAKAAADSAPSQRPGGDLGARYADLQHYILNLQKGLSNAYQALQNLSLHGSTKAPDVPAVLPGSAPAAEVDEEAAKKAERRKYLLARSHLKDAEAALGGGKLEHAVSLSHAAWQESQDTRVFKAMIEVHLRAATRREPTRGTFADDIRWLMCALQDDGTNERIRLNLRRRYFTQTRQLALDGNLSEAGAVLGDLLRLFPGETQAQNWLRQLRRAPPGNLVLEEPGDAG